MVTVGGVWGAAGAGAVTRSREVCGAAIGCVGEVGGGVGAVGRSVCGV